VYIGSSLPTLQNNLPVIFSRFISQEKWQAADKSVILLGVVWVVNVSGGWKVASEVTGA